MTDGTPPRPAFRPLNPGIRLTQEQMDAVRAGWEKLLEEMDRRPELFTYRRTPPDITNA